ncbi:MAG: adenylate/guanylate cyclase domain-containing protein [Granulosicoccus sp.]|nr:adenylate/guanylate cyclase domain-containing protein [Granulosicoccus sp.]
MTSQTLTVLFADLAGSTRLYQTRGDVEAHQRVSDSLQCMKMVVERHQGILLRTVGDAVLASFEQTDSAYLASVDIQREHQSMKLSVRVGFHHGEVIPDAGDVYGNAVNLAARVAAFAEACEICTTEDSVAQLSIRHRANACFLDRVDFKGMSEPMPVYRIQWADDRAETAIITAVSRTQRYQTNLVLDLLIGARRLRIDSQNPSLTFGRAFDNDVIIDTETASRNHARIELARGRFLLHDSSTNGTYLIRGGYTPEFIRRESASLDNFGSIGLGFSPELNSPHVIEFRVTTMGR